VDDPTFHVRAGEPGRAAAHDREYRALGEAVLAATRHLAANPGHVALLAERSGGAERRTHQIRRHPTVLIDPEPWAALVHLEWEGATVEVSPREGGGARVRISEGDREVVGEAPGGTAAAEEALRRWKG
jgi:hypothetical protein